MKVRIKTISSNVLTKNSKIFNIKYIKKKYLDYIGDIGVKSIRKEIDKIKWKAYGAKNRVKKSIFNYIHPENKYVSFGSHKPYIKYQEFGVKRQPMKWLIGLNKPIGPLFFNGKKTFRWSPKNKNVFKQGKWIHPGFKPKRFFAKGIDKIKNFVLSKDLNKIVSDILKGTK